MLATSLPQFSSVEPLIGKGGSLTPIGLRLLNAMRQSLLQQVTPVTFAQLPSPATQGMLVAITDGDSTTWGATLSGGGSSKVLAHYNGTAWTVAAT